MSGMHISWGQVSGNLAYDNNISLQIFLPVTDIKRQAEPHAGICFDIGLTI